MKRICFLLAIIGFCSWGCNNSPEQVADAKVVERGRKTVHPQKFRLKSGSADDSNSVYTAGNIFIKVANGQDSMQTITISKEQKRLINYIRKIDSLPSYYLYTNAGDTIMALLAGTKFTAYRILNNKAVLLDHFFTKGLPELEYRDSVPAFIHHK
ncbi:hypothetical protein [Chitinophaga sp. sic0106]|uniref:hypothetical protein n=1 Tax=Chitinophaga sp. sic0106 TaxID=2854785 RepID=UPI001C47B076|nr:hypothetical protein [Chitinophaga sp. sic0106]MBV7532316.1 hypothetical protein [Chitinophaga sp. sic0106]